MIYKGHPRDTAPRVAVIINGPGPIRRTGARGVHRCAVVAWYQRQAPQGLPRYGKVWTSPRYGKIVPEAVDLPPSSGKAEPL